MPGPNPRHPDRTARPRAATGRVRWRLPALGVGRAQYRRSKVHARGSPTDVPGQQDQPI